MKLVEHLSELFASTALPDSPDVEQLAEHLAASLERRKAELIDCLQAETRFAPHDARESVEGCLAFLRGFRAQPRPRVQVDSASGRSIEIASAPWGTVVVILPHSAFLYLGLVSVLHALDQGNRVLLRAPSGAAGSARVLSEELEALSLGEDAMVVGANAKDLLDAFFASRTPGLVHYFGSSGRIPDLAAECFRAGKGFIGDGEGNAWVYVDETCDPAVAAHVLAEGSTRYNGQTCTSVNGALIHPAIHHEVVNIVQDRLGNLDLGSFADDSIEQVVGQSGGSTTDRYPKLVVDPNRDSSLVTDGVFGPVLWVAAGTAADYRDLWLTNRYPLCAAVLGDVDAADWASLPNLARLVVNGDPSLEDPLEPWGGYPSSGNSRVSGWHEKYRRTVQIDQPR